MPHPIPSRAGRSARALALLALLCAAAHGTHSAQAATPAAISVRDDAGLTVTLAKPAQRVIAMAPHITELLFAAGGGEHVVGGMNFSDYPAAAKRLPLVGSNEQIDLERVLALKPDLLVVWKGGNSSRQIEQLKSLGLPIYYSAPARLDEIATSLIRLGQLLGTDPAAQAAARDYRQKIAALGAKYAQRPPVRLFYQIWDKPLYTLNDEHIVGDAIRLCGGRNVFGGLKVLAPSVGIEAVVQQNPEAIVGGERHEGDSATDSGLAIWRPYKGMLALQRGNLFELSGDLMARATPRMADGTAQLCEKLELARGRRP